MVLGGVCARPAMRLAICHGRGELYVSYPVTVNVAEPLRWPNRCARCGTKHDLASASLALGDVLNSRVRWSGAVEFETRMTQLRYPVCTKHARGLGLAALVNRQTAVMKAVRGVIWFFGVLGLLPTLLLPLGLLRGQAGAQMPWSLVLMVVVPTLLMLVMIWARRAQPVRGIQRDGDDITLRFGNDDYGRAFERANP